MDLHITLLNRLEDNLAIPMAEIADPWILDPEGFDFSFEKTEGF